MRLVEEVIYTYQKPCTFLFIIARLQVITFSHYKRRLCNVFQVWPPVSHLLPDGIYNCNIIRCFNFSACLPEK